MIRHSIEAQSRHTSLLNDVNGLEEISDVSVNPFRFYKVFLTDSPVTVFMGCDKVGVS